MAAAHADRPKPPADVWDWQDYPAWRGAIWELMADVFDDRVKAAFLKHPPKYVVSDDLSWLDNIVWDIHDGGFDADIKEMLTGRLLKRFRAFRAVHGTRTADPSAYYQDGLLPLDPERANQRAKEIFLSDRFPELSAEMLQQVIAYVGADMRSGHVYFEGNEQELIAYCGHYMLYGSEYVTAIAAHLDGVRDYRQILKEKGRPTLFICDVPLEFMGGCSVGEFAGMALAMMFEELLTPEVYRPDSHSGAGFSIRCTLPPDCIVGHYHPTVLRDPLKRHV